VVAIRNAEADRFLARPVPGIVVFLVFGSDPGLVSERMRSLVRAHVADPSDPFQLVRIGGDEVAADPLRLLDEANTIGMFSTRRAVRIEAGSKDISAAVESLLAHPPQDTLVFIEAGSLRSDSALRRACERHKQAAAIECQPDSGQDIDRLIDAEMRAANMKIDHDARQALLQLLGSDRLTTRAEISKLLVYAHGRKEIGMADIEAIVADASAVALDNALIQAFSGKAEMVEEATARLFTSGMDASQVLGAALRHALLIHRNCANPPRSGDGGTDRNARSYSGGYRLLDATKSGWSVQRIGRVVNLLAEAVQRVRREPALAQTLTVRALWSVARAARPSN
jgi:DNA polymerase-3 subunit delta